MILSSARTPQMGEIAQALSQGLINELKDGIHRYQASYEKAEGVAQKQESVRGLLDLVQEKLGDLVQTLQQVEDVRAAVGELRSAGERLFSMDEYEVLYDILESEEYFGEGTGYAEKLIEEYSITRAGG